MLDTLSALDSATAAWAEAIGPAFVSTDLETLHRCETATFATTQRVLAVLRPGSADEVAACMRVANRFGVPVYPISRGRNWGLGSRVPVTDAAILDLGRMNRILEQDETHGTVTLEPGVTFAQAHAFLAERRSAWFLPVIGGPAEASVVGNALERGDVIAPLGDGFCRIISLEVVLPQGEIVHTGYERFGKTGLSSLSATPAGPSADGLFMQCNLGVVTRATVSLSAVPKHLQIMQSAIPQNGLSAFDGLSAFIDALRRLVRDVGGHGCFTLWNGSKILLRDAAQWQSAATAEAPREWFCTSAFYAPSPAMAAAQRELAQQALTPVSAHLQILDEASIPDLRARAGLFLGVPTNENVLSLYAARPGSLPSGFPDPDLHRCGALWLCPEIPFDGAALADAVRMCTDKIEAYGYLPVLAAFVHSPRVLRIFVSILYDRDQPGEDSRALRCHDELLALFAAKGLYPFRLGIQSMHFAQQAQHPFWEMIAKIKAAMDPNEILAPGRYGRRILNDVRREEGYDGPAGCGSRSVRLDDDQPHDSEHAT